MPPPLPISIHAMSLPLNHVARPERKFVAAGALLPTRAQCGKGFLDPRYSYT